MAEPYFMYANSGLLVAVTGALTVAMLLDHILLTLSGDTCEWK